MGSSGGGVVLVKGIKCLMSSSLSLPNKSRFLLNLQNNNTLFRRRKCSTSSTISATSGSLEPPDLPRLAQTARIFLTPHEVEEFAPKIRQVVDWFGQLQAVDLQSVEPAIRADTEGDNLRDDVPQTFEDKEAIIGAVPNYEDPYIKVPKVLNKE